MREEKLARRTHTVCENIALPALLRSESSAGRFSVRL
jgi:hypothetical protein